MANAPHIPVHLGAMQEAVQWQASNSFNCHGDECWVVSPGRVVAVALESSAHHVLGIAKRFPTTCYLTLVNVIIAERLSARQVILQRRPPSQLGFVYTIIYIM